MTRKHFVLIAEAIRNSVADVEARRRLAEALMPALRASNDRFDAGKFLRAAVG